MRSFLKGKLGKVLLPVLLFVTLVVVPLVSIGAMWIQHVGLLPDTAVVFSSDAAAMDRFMAAALKPYYGDRIGICDGVNDHVEIQAALDAVRDVKISVGQFNCELTLDIDNSDQTLRGCGRNSILTTTTADMAFLSAVGSAGSELTGILIEDIQVDGGAGLLGDIGIYFEYVDHSLIQHTYVRRCQSATGSHLNGIFLINSDYNIITGNTVQEADYVVDLESCCYNTISYNVIQGGTCGLYLYNSSNHNTITGNTCQGNGEGIYLCVSNDHNTITGNTCQGNNSAGIYLYSSNDNTITGNTCQGNSEGIYPFDSSGNTIANNTCQGNGGEGIILHSSNDNTITGNTLTENSQSLTNNSDDICLENSDYNNIQGNTCRAGALANKPRYGINILDPASDGNLVTNNDIHNDGFGTGSFNDAGTGTVTVAGNRI